MKKSDREHIDLENGAISSFIMMLEQENSDEVKYIMMEDKDLVDDITNAGQARDSREYDIFRNDKSRRK